MATETIRVTDAPTRAELADAIDLECHSVRDFLGLVAAVREAKPRDPLRALEDVLLDLVAP